jgi:exopolysaccharide biosynthesis polyprenyl glycosylphosphotransferase
MALIVCGVISMELRGYTILSGNFTLFDVFLVIATCMTCLAIIGGYETSRDMSTLRYASEHVLAMGVVLLVAFIETYAFSSFNHLVKPGRSVLLFWLILFTSLSLVYRYLLSKKAGRDAAARFIYAVGTPELVSNLEEICRQAHFRHPLRFLDLSDARGFSNGMQKDRLQDDDHPLMEALSERMHQCEGVVIDLFKGKLKPELEELLLKINLHMVPVYPVESFIETYFHMIYLPHVTLSWALEGTFKADNHSAYGKLKTLIDTVLGIVLFLMVLPLMLLTALVIKLAEPGPILFTQVRIGRFDRPFVIYKFRTMGICSSEHESLYTLKDDSRITKVGRILRLTHLDELPQLWNVIKGDMSIIGPRAEWDKLVERYKKEIPFYHLRHMVKPGITGWAQVNYSYGGDISDACKKLQYDLYYIKHCSPQMDASIILKTFFTMLSASGR